MKFGFCSKQKEVAAAMRQGPWPGGCDPALEAHVAACRDCNDLVLVIEALRQARRETMQELSLSSSRLPSAETLWWRRELRLRSGAVERVTRPIAVIEKLGLIGIPLAMLAVAVWQWNQIAGWLFPPDDLSSSSGFHWDSFWTASSAAGWTSVLLMASLGTFVLIWGLVLFMVTEKD